MGKLAKLLREWTDRLERKNNEIRRKHGLPEDRRASEYRERKYRERAEKKKPEA